MDIGKCLQRYSGATAKKKGRGVRKWQPVSIFRGEDLFFEDGQIY